MTTKNILDALVTLAPAEINLISKPGPRCVMATRVGQLALAQFAVTAQPFPVELSLFNDAWRAWGDDDFAGGVEEQLRRGAHFLTNMPNWKGGELPSLNPTPASSKPWDGHLVLRVDSWLVDLDLGQMSRPTKRILVPPAVVAPLRPDDIVDGQVTVKGITTYVHYKPLIAPYADEYLTAKDWTRGARGYAPVVSSLVRKMQLALGR